METIDAIKNTLKYPEFMPLDNSAVICIEVSKLIKMMNNFANKNGETTYTETQLWGILGKLFFERTGFSYSSFPKDFERDKKIVELYIKGVS
jgi:hypothetical protein